MEKKVVVGCLIVGGVLLIGTGVGIHLGLTSIAAALSITASAVKAALIASGCVGGTLLIIGGGTYIRFLVKSAGEIEALSGFLPKKVGKYLLHEREKRGVLELIIPKEVFSNIKVVEDGWDDDQEGLQPGQQKQDFQPGQMTTG